MGFKESTPGLLISLVSIVLLALVSFNTPLLKSLYFLKATYSDVEMTFGTLGYCSTATSGGTQTCVGPTIGYEFDFTTVFGISETVISIPNVVTKLTYVLIVHVAALGCALIALVLSALATIRDFSLLCFPSLFAYLTSALTLLAFVIDLVIFYIMRARINAVSGASATIGVAVWLTLAAWVVTAIAGCCFSIGSCCATRNRQGQRDAGKYSGVDDREKNAYAMGSKDGRAVGPSMYEREVSAPLINANGQPVPEEDKYLVPEGDYANTLGRADTVNGVGYGHGRRTPRPASEAGGGLYPFLATDPADPQQHQHNQYAAYQPSHPGDRSGTPTTMAGSFVGVGAGRSMQTIPWAGGPGMAPGGGGAVQGAPGYIPGGSQVGYAGHGQHQDQGGYDSYAQSGSYGHGANPSSYDQGRGDYQDPYNQQQAFGNTNNASQAAANAGGYDNSQIYGQPTTQQQQPLQPIPRHLEQSSGMQNIVSPVESHGSHNQISSHQQESYGGYEAREELSNAYGGYAAHHLAPSGTDDGTGDIGGARPPSYDSAQVGSGVYASNQQYRGYRDRDVPMLVRECKEYLL